MTTASLSHEAVTCALSGTGWDSGECAFSNTTSPSSGGPVRESEKWRLVAEQVANGQLFDWLVLAHDIHGTRDVSNGRTYAVSKPVDTDQDVDCLYALLLAEDAADEENENREVVGVSDVYEWDSAGFTPIHITYCAEDPPMPAVFVGPEPEQDEPEVSFGN
jgi:hypothetical protein